MSRNNRIRKEAVLNRSCAVNLLDESKLLRPFAQNPFSTAC